MGGLGDRSLRGVAECAAVAASFKVLPHSFFTSDPDAASYRIERARSSRSSCCAPKCKAAIPQGALRMGCTTIAGGWGHWRCMACLRVPAAVQPALPEEADAVREVLGSTGLSAVLEVEEGLSLEELDAVAARLADRTRWAKARAPKPAQEAGEAADADAEEPAAPPPGTGSPAGVLAAAPAAKPAGPLDGLPPADGTLFKGKTFVLSGVFDVAGSAGGFKRGKDGVQAYIETHGGRVTGSVSKKTDFLVTGHAGGLAKMQHAAALGVRVVDLEGLGCLVRGEAPADAKITSLSAGFGGSGLAKRIGSSRSLVTYLAGPAVMPVMPAV